MEPVSLHGQSGTFSRSNKPRADLRYGTYYPSRPNWPIFKVKRAPEQTSVKTLAMELVGPNGQYNPFSRRPLRPYLWSQLALTAKRTHFQGQTNPGARTSIKTLAMEPVGPHGQNGPFSKSNEPGAEFVKTLTMEPVGPHGQNILFSRSNES
ncbi:hypothetical protein H5410_058791 [Solanum commersonii]|uniref:Uncharacterized protein n=1 Tax=Solanum commersonii TaxID=4109 RepID=A0A9J5WS46_SOLCO|nr:hypothetical protein H5410_058791 [Solanum commersonii]